MDEKQKQALAIYLVVVVVLGWFAHTNLAVPMKRRRDDVQREVQDLKAKQDALRALKGKFAEESGKRSDAKETLDVILARFPVPKGRQGDANKKVYDSFSLSEQISAAAHGLALAPKETPEPDHILYQSSRVEEEDLSSKGDAIQDPSNKAALDPDKSRIYNFLSVDAVRFRYQISGDYKDLIGFMEALARQPTFFDISELDLFQKGQAGSLVQASLMISSLDLSDGLLNPAAGQ